MWLLLAAGAALAAAPVVAVASASATAPASVVAAPLPSATPPATVAATAAVGSTPVPRRRLEKPQLRVVASASRVGLPNRFDPLVVSARAHGIDVVVLGAGRTAYYPERLNFKIQVVRDYAWAIGPEDIVMHVDAWDTLITADADAIVAAYTALERADPARFDGKVLFNAERGGFWCWGYPGDGECTVAYETKLLPSYVHPPSSRFRYLNSGVYIGRASTIRALYGALDDGSFLPEYSPHTDQWWVQERLLGAFGDGSGARNDRAPIALDSGCALFLTTFELDCRDCTAPGRIDWVATGAELVTGGGDVSGAVRIKTVPFDTYPAVLHFQGSGHWNDPWFNTAMSRAYEHLHPVEAERSAWRRSTLVVEWGMPRRQVRLGSPLNLVCAALLLLLGVIPGGALLGALHRTRREIAAAEERLGINGGPAAVSETNS